MPSRLLLSLCMLGGGLGQSLGEADNELKAPELNGRAGGRGANAGEELRAERQDKTCAVATLPKGIDVKRGELVVLKP